MSKNKKAILLSVFRQTWPLPQQAAHLALNIGPACSVFSCLQIDLSFGSQVPCLINIHSQKLLPNSKVTSSTTTQAEAWIDPCFQKIHIHGLQNPTDGAAGMCRDISKCAVHPLTFPQCCKRQTSSA